VIQHAIPIEGARGTSDPAGVGDFFALLKPRVMSLVVFTAFVGMAVAPGEIHPVLGFAALLCIAVGAGAAGCLNMWYDADIDAGMARTANRPIPAGRMDAGAALGFGSTLAVFAVVSMYLFVNWAAAALLALTIAFYVFVYTIWLKRRTPQNIVIGGAAGAFPPMIGWAAVTGNVGIGALVLFAIIFFWTPPHFWALALLKKAEYAKVGVPMLPVVAGDAETRRQILLYSLLLAPLGVLPSAVGVAGAVYALVAAALGLVFLALAWRLYRSGSDKDAGRLFGFSLLYLFALFAALLVEHGLRWVA
jgi:protoheme IX farnesyltransferase